MAFSADEEQAIKELAEMEGRSVEDVKREMLRARLGLGSASQPAGGRSLVRTVGTGDASGAALAQSRSEAVSRHQSRDFPGSPVVRYGEDPYGETPEQAQERWLEEEASLVDGVHGLGGQTAGGIFGGGPIATSIYDPEAEARADARVGQMANIRLLGLVERLEERLGGGSPPPQLGGKTPRALPGTGRRRLPPRGDR